MLSRTLSTATVTLLAGCLTAAAVLAVENLEAGKTPSQIFSGTCNACHKSPRGLLKTVPASSLPGFLRQHYTTSSDMASVLASFLVSNGAADTRYQAKDSPKQDPGKKDARQEAKQDSRPEARPDGAAPQGEGARPEPGWHQSTSPVVAAHATHRAAQVQAYADHLAHGDERLREQLRRFEKPIPPPEYRSGDVPW